MGNPVRDSRIARLYCLPTGFVSLGQGGDMGNFAETAKVKGKQFMIRQTE